jgi:hypothetical protein
MDVSPASIDQIGRLADGRLVTITADAGGVADSIRRIDPCLRLRYSESGDCWIVYRIHRQGQPCAEDDPERTEELVLTAQECDQRIVKRLEFIDPQGRGGYDYAEELEKSALRARDRQRESRMERYGEVAEQTAYALRKDLGLGPYRGRIFKPREF